MKKFIAIALLCSTLGCTDADISRITALGSKHKITMWSGGKEAKVWVSTGKPQTVKESDGWFFTDQQTGRLVYIGGNVSIEQQ